MKKIISLFILILMIFCMSLTAFSYSNTYYYTNEKAIKSDQVYLLDGNMIYLPSYKIKGNNYVKLRDLAFILSQSDSCFNIYFDPGQSLITLKSKEKYESFANDLEPISTMKANARLSSQEIVIDNNKVYLDTANIKNNNYIRLRDLAQYLDFRIDYDDFSKSVTIYTSLRERLKGKIDDAYLTERFYELVEEGLTYDEAELAMRINEYRRQIGKSEFRISKSLTTVARTHVKDSNTYKPEEQYDERGIKGNLHSWSNNGPWSGGAYTSDHKHASIMWDKPRELTSYPGNGYEIAMWCSGVATPDMALDGWKKSAGHNSVIIGSGFWDKLTCMGVGIDGSYSHVWFGVEDDPEGYY